MTRRHPRIERTLYRLAFEEPTARELRRLFAHLKRCEACRSYRDKILGLQRILGNRSSQDLERDQLRRVATALGVELAESGQTRAEAQTRSWQLPVLASSAAALGIAILLFLATGVFEPTADGLQERALLPGDVRGARLHVYCFADDPAKSPVRKLRPLVAQAYRNPDDRCGLTDRMGFEVSAGETPPPFVFVFGLDERLTPLWYHPIPREGRSLPVRSDEGEQMLPGVVSLSTNHRRGALKVFALYSVRPLSVTDVARAIEQARETDTDLESFEMRMDGIVAQERLDLVLE